MFILCEASIDDVLVLNLLVLTFITLQIITNRSNGSESIFFWWVDLQRVSLLLLALAFGLNPRTKKGSTLEGQPLLYHARICLILCRIIDVAITPKMQSHKKAYTENKKMKMSLMCMGSTFEFVSGCSVGDNGD